MYNVRGRPNYYRGDDRFFGLFAAPFAGGLLGGLIGGGIAGFGTAALISRRPFYGPYPPIGYGYGPYPVPPGYGYPPYY